MRSTVLVMALLFGAACAMVTCKKTIADTTNKRSYEYDLSPLNHPDDTYVDTLWYRTNDNEIYYVNFCGQTASDCETQDVSVCIRQQDGENYKYTSGGKTSTQKITIAEASGQTPSTSVTVTYSDGGSCGSGKHKTKIYVNCQPTANPGYFYNIDQPNSCEATLYMWAASGCGTDVPYTGPTGGGGGETAAIVILVLLLVAVVVYFAGGALYQWRVKQAQTPSEFIIHRDFWCALPFLIKDGALFIAHGCKKGDYVSL